VSDIVIGLSKSARAGYSFDDVAVAPHRRTRDPEAVDLRWTIDAYSFDLPILAAPMDSVVSPRTAILMGQAGGLAVLNLEGLWTRYEDPEEVYEQIRAVPREQAVPLLQRAYAEPIKPELIATRVRQMREANITVAGSLSPQKTHDLFRDVISAGVDLFVIRGTTVSAEHVSDGAEPLNLKQFIYELDVPVLVGGVATYQSALHLMRSGAAGVLVGFGGGASHTTTDVLGVRVPMATAVADVAAARRDYLDESGGRYVHVVADGAMGRSGDIVKAVACGADAVMVGSLLARAEEAPGAGRHWGMEATHEELPRGELVEFGTAGTWREILFGPSRVSDGTMNLAGALARSVALCGYSDLKSFQRVEMVTST
jgi:IMP dehydrogenase